ncbi:MAG TPA: hypothetical protein PK317_00290 [Coprothermobacter proteolyticus]|nr:hypothetical protein [Coprothermobacter proteolyticus]
MNRNFDRHGGPADRGSADKFYGRPKTPHYFVGATYASRMVEQSEMTAEEIKAYSDAYDTTDTKKDWS